MKRIIVCVFAAVLSVVLLAGCQGNIMSQSEKLFINMIDKTAGKLDLNENQKVQLERNSASHRIEFLTWPRSLFLDRQSNSPYS